jgi:hypothetical protein
VSPTTGRFVDVVVRSMSRVVNEDHLHEAEDKTGKPARKLVQLNTDARFG